ncbi:uncharacterized protein LOC134357570 isoform X1 [Mobula hypostoma]|uniref:uncharacterized protein LOC134357570 isoform X1 n=1 Tax=Mobula hypostoma TaxID=723540 RepID=UPI002FC35816
MIRDGNPGFGACEQRYGWALWSKGSDRWANCFIITASRLLLVCDVRRGEGAVNGPAAILPVTSLSDRSPAQLPTGRELRTASGNGCIPSCFTGLASPAVSGAVERDWIVRGERPALRKGMLCCPRNLQSKYQRLILCLRMNGGN